MWIKSEYFCSAKLWKLEKMGEDSMVRAFWFKNENGLCKQKKSTFKS